LVTYERSKAAFPAEIAEVHVPEGIEPEENLGPIEHNDDIEALEDARETNTSFEVEVGGVEKQSDDKEEQESDEEESELEEQPNQQCKLKPQELAEP
jgi:hypothetical protein